jgi:hypothetical protein
MNLADVWKEIARQITGRSKAENERDARAEAVT